MAPTFKIVCEKGNCYYPKMLPGNPYLTRREVESDEEEITPRFRHVREGPTNLQVGNIITYYKLEPILTKIVSYASEDGVNALHNWILSSREGVAACHSDEFLSSVRLDKSPVFVWMSRPRSGYFRFYCKCLKANDPYVVYLESLKRVFVCLDLEAAIELTTRVKHKYLLAELLYIVLNSCAGHEDVDAYNKFRKEHWRLREVNQMTDALMYHVNRINPRRCGTFLRTWNFDDFPVCWERHEFLREFNGERCLDCLYYYLSLELAHLF